jgi:hypothetical protein
VVHLRPFLKQVNGLIRQGTHPACPGCIWKNTICAALLAI